MREAMVAAVAVWCAPGANAEWENVSTVLTAPGANAGDAMGRCVATDGQRVVVGVPYDDVPVAGGMGVDRGSVEVFRRIGTAWQHEATLTAPEQDAARYFGASVALDGERLVAGTPFYDGPAGVAQGAVYVFEREGAAWALRARITADDAAEGDNFGSSVALAGGTIAVGAPGDEEWAGAYQGSVSVYTVAGGMWSREAKLIDSDAGPGDSLGVCVAIDGNTIASGAFFDDGPGGYAQGSVSVFVRAGGVWSQQAKLTAAAGAALDLFGQCVALEGDTLAVGAFFDDNAAGLNQGSVTVFGRSGSAWMEGTTLTAPDAAIDDNFGYSAAIDGERLLVGAAYADGFSAEDQGAAYLFARSAGGWAPAGDAILAPDAAAGDVFGYSVGMKGDLLVVGASGDDDAAGADQGSAVVWVTTCAGDTNGDGRVDGADLSVLLGTFNQSVAPGSGADFNSDGVVNGADLSVLLGRFGVVC